MTTLFHTTGAAEVILRDGFRDGSGSYMFSGITLTGVFLANRPVDCNEGATGDQVLEVALPDGLDLSQWAIEEEGLPVWEWCVPAEVVNRHGSLRLLTEDELEEFVLPWAVEWLERDRRRRDTRPDHPEPHGPGQHQAESGAYRDR